MGILIASHDRLLKKHNTLAKSTASGITGLLEVIDMQSKQVETLVTRNRWFTLAIIVQAVYLIIML